MPKAKGRVRHTPLRTCVGCRGKRDKRELIRVVRTPEGQLELDVTGRRAGRGAYLCPNPDCWEQAFKRKALNRALRVVLTPEEVARLRQYARSLVEPTVEADTSASSADGRGAEVTPPGLT